MRRALGDLVQRGLDGDALRIATSGGISSAMFTVAGGIVVTFLVTLFTAVAVAAPARPAE